MTQDLGKIAAANAISDVYAMGAEPVMALAILGFPEKLSPEVAHQIMVGGAETCKEAGIRLAGGHSIDDTEPKFGLSVSGVGHPDEMWSNATAQDGDVLVLTKPLGIGAMGSAMKKGVLSPEGQATFVQNTTFLNAAPARAARAVGIHAATDVTGFGLIGHGLEMARGAGLCVELWVDALPVIPEAVTLMASGVVPGATRRNLEFVEDSTTWDADVNEIDQKIVADPQTSGGLLFAVAADKVSALIAACEAAGCLCATAVGRVVSGQGVRVVKHPPKAS